MPERPTYITLSEEETMDCRSFYSDLKGRVGKDAGWARVEIRSLPNCFPEKLLDKCGQEAVAVFSDVSTGHLLCVNARRWDDPADSVDQHPIAFFMKDGQNAKRVIVEHGTWANRTTNAVSSDYEADGCLLPGVSDCLILNTLPEADKGDIDSLRAYGDRDASRATFDFLIPSDDQE